jgi:hypothetical protein
MAVSAQAMNQAWNTLVICKAARTNPALLHYLLSKDDQDEEEDPDEWAEYGPGPTPLEGEEPLARRHEIPPHIGEDTYTPKRHPSIDYPPSPSPSTFLEMGWRDMFAPQSPESAVDLTTPAEAPVGEIGVTPRAVSPTTPAKAPKPKPDEEDEDEGATPVPKP